MVDIHTHIIPGIDDGAKDLDDSLEMCRMAYADGIRTLVATPHALWSSQINTGPTIRGGLAEVAEALEAAQIPIRVVSGCEVPMERNLASRLSVDPSWTIGGAGVYLLLEPPWGPIPEYCANLIESLLEAAITPIIAHPERNPDLQMNPHLVQKMIDMGCLTQVTAHSLLGKHGGKAKEVGWSLVEAGSAHIIASDAHNAKNRAPQMSQARAQVAERMGDGIAQRIFQDTPQQVVDGLPVAFARTDADDEQLERERRERRPANGGGFFGLFRRRR